MYAVRHISLPPVLLSIALTAALAGCGGSSDDSGGPPPPPPPATAPFSVGGTVAGLSGTVVLQESQSGDSIAVTSNGAFTFPEEVAQNGSYAVTVYKQPAGQNCTVAAGSGNATNDVTNIAVSCGNEPFAVSGTVTGSTAPVTLQLNLADNTTVNADGAFNFSKTLASGTDYAVTVVPNASTTQSCTVSNGTGTISAAVTNVTVTCTPLGSSLAVGGTIQGLSGTPVILSLESTGVPPTFTTSTNGAFEFATPLPVGTAYRVTVTTHPAGQYCVVGNAGGVVTATSRVSVGVECFAGALPTGYTVGGTVAGLTGTLQLALSKNNSPLSVSSGATSFTFPEAIPAGSDFRVTVAAQPTGQTCIVPNGGITMGNSNVTGVTVTCVANDTDSLSGTFIRYDNDMALTFYPGGIYVYGSVEASAACGASNGNGIEVGAYDYNASAGTIAFISNVLDTNGSTCGVWRNGTTTINGSLSKTGSGQHQVLVISGGGMTPANVLVPVASVPNTPIGSFTNGTLSFTVFMPDGRYLETNAVDVPGSNYAAGVEAGCYARTGTISGTITVTACAGSVDTDGNSGLSVLSGNPLAYAAVGAYAVSFGNGRYFGTRIVPGG
jgi:hypothetical protein